MSAVNVSDFVYYDETSKSCLRFAKNNKEAGYLDNTGYYRVAIKGKRYQTHRIVAHLRKGMPIDSPLCVDHIDRNRLNNHEDNLRVVTKQENNRNRAIPKPSFCKQTGRWKAYGRNMKWLGRYDTYEEAQEVINESERG